ncbi:hypothetical protein D9M68_100040 [compost metagenome]
MAGKRPLAGHPGGHSPRWVRMAGAGRSGTVARCQDRDESQDEADCPPRIARFRSSTTKFLRELRRQSSSGHPGAVSIRCTKE